MPYTQLQQTTIAREIARSGGNLTAAAKRLRDDYETFRTICDKTLSRMTRRAGFAELIAAEGELLRRAQAEGVEAAERDRARREAEGLIVNRLARDEMMLDELRNKLEAKLKDSNPKDIAEAVRAFQSLAIIIDRRKAQNTVAVASFNEGALLVQAVAEAAELMLGPRKKEFVKLVQDPNAKLDASLKEGEVPVDTNTPVEPLEINGAVVQGIIELVRTELMTVEQALERLGLPKPSPERLEAIKKRILAAVSEGQPA